VCVCGICCAFFCFDHFIEMQNPALVLASEKRKQMLSCNSSFQEECH
jgi:hypothetical protein